MSDINWPKLIKDARLNLGETQERFAKRFAVTTNTVSRWGNGNLSNIFRRCRMAA
jgi:DNA-binding transcriptional regulator YiaG